MLESGLSENAFDKFCGISKTGGYTSRVIRGEKRQPVLSVIERVASATRVRPAWLAFGDEPRRAVPGFDRLVMMPAIAFLSRLLRLPKLIAAIEEHPKKNWTIWHLAGVLDDLHQKSSTIKDGEPVRGTWAELVDEKAVTVERKTDSGRRIRLR